MTVADMDKEEVAEIAKGFEDLGYVVIATSGTAKFLKEKGVTVKVATKVSEGHPNILDDIKLVASAWLLILLIMVAMQNVMVSKSVVPPLSMLLPA